MKITLRLALLLFCLTPLLLSAQYRDVRLMDQMRQQVNQKDAPQLLTTKGTETDVSQLNTDEKVEYLEKAMRPIVAERYLDIANKPYYYAEFRDGVLADAVNNGFPLRNLNYNAFEKRFEYQYGENHVSFEPQYFPRVQFSHPDGSTTLFVRGLLKDFPGDYVAVEYNGLKVKAATHFFVKRVKNEGFSAGKNVAHYRFVRDEANYVLLNGVWVPASRKPKAFAKLFGRHGPAVLTFIKEEGLKLGRAEDLRRATAYAESLKFPQSGE